MIYKMFQGYVHKDIYTFISQVYLSFWRIKQLGVFLLPIGWDASPLQGGERRGNNDSSRARFLESPETFRAHFGWHNSLCVFKTKASWGTKLCSYFNFYSLYKYYEKVSFTEWAGRSFTNGFSGPKSLQDFREMGPYSQTHPWKLKPCDRTTLLTHSHDRDKWITTVFMCVCIEKL